MNAIVTNWNIYRNQCVIRQFRAKILYLIPLHAFTNVTNIKRTLKLLIPLLPLLLLESVYCYMFFFSCSRRVKRTFIIYSLLINSLCMNSVHLCSAKYFVLKYKKFLFFLVNCASIWRPKYLFIFVILDLSSMHSHI